MASGKYARLGGRPREPSGGGRVASACSWLCIGALLVLGGGMLRDRLLHHFGTSSVYEALLGGDGANNRSTPLGNNRRPVSLVPMSLAGSLMADRRRQRRRWKASARPQARGVIVVGSHSALGMQVLRRVFGALCARPRLALWCEGRTPDPDRARKLRRAGIATVRFERGASRLRAALRPPPGSRAAPTRVVALLWDPFEACVAEGRWADSNASLATRCSSLNAEEIGPLLRAVGKRRERAMVLRLGDVAGAEPIALAKWRGMLHLLGVHEPGVHLASIAASAARNDREGSLKSKVRNTQAPAWAREAIRANATLSTALRRLRRELAAA
jgi:hypothetical protein